MDEADAVEQTGLAAMPVHHPEQPCAQGRHAGEEKRRQLRKAAVYTVKQHEEGGGLGIRACDFFPGKQCLRLVRGLAHQPCSGVLGRFISKQVHQRGGIGLCTKRLIEARCARPRAAASPVEAAGQLDEDCILMGAEVKVEGDGQEVGDRDRREPQLAHEVIGAMQAGLEARDARQAVVLAAHHLQQRFDVYLSQAGSFRSCELAAAFDMDVPALGRTDGTDMLRFR